MNIRPRFLATPGQIRERVGWLAGNADRLDLAVAFVGRDWRDAIADFQGRLRVVCWLSSTNTNPMAVRQMINRRRTEVRQRDSMHAKVYFRPGTGAVVGSANLSRRALSDADVSGQDEAAVLLTDAASLKVIGEWFESLWRSGSTRRISKADLEYAEIAFRRARTFNKGTRPRQAAGAQRGRAHVWSLERVLSASLRELT